MIAGFAADSLTRERCLPLSGTVLISLACQRPLFPADSVAHAPEHLSAVAQELNSRPRKTLGWETPAERLAKLLDLAS